MPYPLSLDMQPKQTQKQSQRLMMTPQMQQAIHLLQLPLMELTQMIEQEVEQNPVLEYMPEEEDQEESEEKESLEKEMEFNDKQFEILRQLDEEFRDFFSESGQYIPKRSSEEEKKKVFLESLVQEEPSLNEHLMQQAREEFSDPEELKIAEAIFGYIDENGFLKTPLNEIAICFSFDLSKTEKVLKTIQTFDPIGVGSSNVKEVLLTQLKAKGLKNSLAYQIVENHFDDLLHNRLPIIQKGVKASLKEIKEAIQNVIAHLDLHPGTSYSKVEAPTIIPDVRLRQEGEKLIIDINEDHLQPLRLNRKYLRMLDDPNLPNETKDFIRTKILSAKWLMKNIFQRSDTLHRIAEFLLKYQHQFFLDPSGSLKPLTMKVLGDDLGLHESTIARACANKYIETPRGVFPFRYFFSNSYSDEKGNDISSKTIKKLITEWIEKEDKHKPLSDEDLSKKISQMGIQCARRTVAKYRRELKFGNTQQRRAY